MYTSIARNEPDIHGETSENCKEDEVQGNSDVRCDKPDGNKLDSRSASQQNSGNEENYLRGRGMERYTNSLKNLIPIRRKAKEKQKAPVDSAGLFSSISFSWFSKFMYQARKAELKVEELPPVSPYDACLYNGERLELLWNEELVEKGPEKASFTRVAWKFCRTRVYATFFVFAISLFISFLCPTLLMRKLLEYVESGTGRYEEGIKWALLLSIAELFRMMFFTWAWALSYRTALRLRSACFTLLYRKIIRVNNLGNKGMGEIINMFSNDALKIFELVLFGPMLIGGPIYTVWGIIYILWLFGPMALLGMTIFLIFYPAQFLISRFSGYLQSRAVKISDTRVRLMSEILDCVKLIKMYAWERRFTDELRDIRKREQKILTKSLYCQSISISMAPNIPVISAMITFLSHVAAGHNLTSAQVFPYVSLLDSRFSTSLTLFQYSIESIVAARISFSRIKSALLLEEGNCSILKPMTTTQAIGIIRGTFACNTFGNQDVGTTSSNNNKKKIARISSRVKSKLPKLSKPTVNAEHVDVLFDISFEATKGKLIGICGHVGSGKSSLLLAALGQLRVSEGQVMRDGSCAYVSQQAWISNTTLRENILFGKEFNHGLYWKVIYTCSLDQDINTMPGGDRTEIGEKGVNLSGGQKQRVALARALYADRDIYFLDDPLSAVDTCVGAYIFDNLILGALREKTVIFVTHQIYFLSRCDELYMMHNGRIIEHGTHEELMKQGKEYAAMITATSSDDNGNKNSKHKIKDPIARIGNTPPNTEYICTGDKEKAGTLTVADQVQQGTIQKYTYHSYIMAAGGYLFVSVVVLTFIATIASTTFSSWWLAVWINAGGGNVTTVRNNVTMSSDNINDNPDFWYYRTVYIGTIGMILFTSILRSFIVTRATVAASTNLHNSLLRKIIESPMRFFETTPTGRIQHLFSRDMDELDSKLPQTVAHMIQNIFTLMFAMLVVCVVFPWFIVALCVLVIVYYFVSDVFRVGVRDLKRMENKTRAPLFSFISSSVQGLSTIHAFGKESKFMATFVDMFDENSKCVFMSTVSNRWLAVRVDFLSVLTTGTTALLVIALHEKVPSALAGLALSYSAHICGIMQFAIKVASDTEVRFISVERICHYIKALVTEGSSSSQSAVIPESNWPAKAGIKFDNVDMAYGDSAPLILRDVSFSVDAGEKIGIVGRTGSGKSSLTVALFRLVELAKGTIKVDNLDISAIALDNLRTKLSIIPQDPILFSGTIRSNLDPFKRCADAEIWQALEKTKLKLRVQSIPGNLDASVGFGGDNLSVGERQLLCLSRALLRDSKILVLDEATSAVDPETEIVVQNTIQREFTDCTILIIAHRLQTVLSLNRVLVMDDGKVLEFDTPANLLSKESSQLSKMLAASEHAVTQ